MDKNLDLSACPLHALRRNLKQARLRPTRQRMILGWLLFGKGARHVNAEQLHEEAHSARAPISLATVYNTLHQFTQAGLLREVTLNGSRNYFDTNVMEHHHFLDESSGALKDLPEGALQVIGMPPLPEGVEIARIDIVVRLRAAPASLARLSKEVH